MRLLVKVLIASDWCPYKRLGRTVRDTKHVHTTLTKGQVTIQLEGSHLQAEKRGIRRNQCCQCLYLQQLGEKNLLLSHPVCGTLLQQT